MATHSVLVAQRIPWTEKSGGLQSMGLQSAAVHGVAESDTTERLNNRYLNNQSRGGKRQILEILGY